MTYAGDEYNLSTPEWHLKVSFSVVFLKVIDINSSASRGGVISTPGVKIWSAGADTVAGGSIPPWWAPLRQLVPWTVPAYSRLDRGKIGRTSKINRIWCSQLTDCRYTVSTKKEATKLLPITFSNLNRFSKFFHCWIEDEYFQQNCVIFSTTP